MEYEITYRIRNSLFPSVPISAGMKEADDYQFCHRWRCFSYMISKWDSIGRPAEIVSKALPFRSQSPDLIFTDFCTQLIFISPVLRHNQAFGGLPPNSLWCRSISLLHRPKKNDHDASIVVYYMLRWRNYPWSRRTIKEDTGKNRFGIPVREHLWSDNMNEDDSVIDITHQDHNIYDSGIQMADAMVKQIVTS